MRKGSGPLLQIRVTSDKLSRTLVFPRSFTLYNVHRMLQYSLKPGTNDTFIDKKPWAFRQGELKPKSTKSGRFDAVFELAVDDTFEYTSGDTTNFVPRCIEYGIDDLDIRACNRKLLLKRFNPNQSINKKNRETPRVLVHVDDSDEHVWSMFDEQMRKPLVSHEEERAFRSAIMDGVLKDQAAERALKEQNLQQYPPGTAGHWVASLP
ncbi:hypothetical protein HKX48_005567 [Thoreauomyces humboldtii]|nr:hypothetical protein HKX48_005567 [Thoreauomyces humboldtii]